MGASDLKIVNLLTHGQIGHNIHCELGLQNCAEFRGVKGNIIRSQYLGNLSKGK